MQPTSVPGMIPDLPFDPRFFVAPLSCRTPVESNVTGYYGRTMARSSYSLSSSHYRYAPRIDATNASPVGRLHPVDPSSWDTAANEHDTDSTAEDDVFESRSKADELQSTMHHTQKPSRQRRARGRHAEGSCKAPLDNAPPPLGLDEHSFTLLKDSLWQPDAATLPSAVICRFDGCGKSVSTEERRLCAHLIDSHGVAPNREVIQCRWTDKWGEICGARTASRNYRVHVLDFHLRAMTGRCIICHKKLTNKANMKRHLKSCLRGCTIDDMWDRFKVRIVRLDPTNGSKGRYRYMPPSMSQFV
ncbi:hypothetical protein PENSPDRAFT_681917 [Peniophora sp. CONT]|nr:hypothetical protein PENSPDRAFT_681917 [Peniophora sp. CONT]